MLLAYRCAPLREATIGKEGCKGKRGGGRGGGWRSVTSATKIYHSIDIPRQNEG